MKILRALIVLTVLCSAVTGTAYLLKPLNCFLGAETHVGSPRYYSLFPSREIKCLVRNFREEDLTYIVDGDPGIGSPREYIEFKGVTSNLKESIISHLKNRGFGAKLPNGEIDGVWTSGDGREIIIGEYGGKHSRKVFIGI